MKLLDVNVWLAGAWARHRHHRLAKAWLDQQEDELAFCHVTQMAFLQLMTNPAVTGPDALSRRAHHHLLWADDYLAAFAQSADAELMTIDEPFRTRYPSVRVIVLS